MTDRLHDLLWQAVPDDVVALDPGTVVAAARRARRRRRAATGGVAATVLVAGAALGAVTWRERDDHVADRLVPDPYSAPVCPVPLPSSPAGEDGPEVVDSLDGLVSVRVCPDLPPVADLPGGVEAARRVLAAMDALVSGLDDFRERVAGLDGPSRAACGSLPPAGTGRALQLQYDDGRTRLVRAVTCGPVEVAGHEVDGGALVGAYLSGLRAQRTVLGAPAPSTARLDCDETFRVPTPAEPGRGHVVDALRCGPNGNGTPLSKAQVAALDAAWRHPEAARGDDGDCSPRPQYLSVVTDEADVLTLNDSGCGYLTWTGLDQDAILPTTLADLGVTR